MLHNTIVKLTVLVIEVLISENACLHQIATKVTSLEQLSVYIRHCCPESLQNHLPVLLPNNLVPSPTCWVNFLLTYRFYFGYYLR